MYSFAFIQAKKFFSRYDLGNALACILDARNEFPEDICMLELHAKILYAMKDFEKSEPLLRQYFLRDDSNISIIYRLVDILFVKQRYDEIINLLQNYRSMDDLDYKLQVQFADAYIANGQPEEAISHLEPLIVQHPDSAQYWHHLSIAYLAAHQFEKAKHSAFRCLEIEPRSSKALLVLADLYVIYRDQISDASNIKLLLCSQELNEKLCKTLIKVNKPDYLDIFCPTESMDSYNPNTLFSLSYKALENQMYEYFSHIVEVFFKKVPSANRTITKYGNEYFDKNDYDRAYACFLACHSVEPCNSYIVRCLGECLLKLGKIDQALKVVDDFKLCKHKSIYVEYLRARILCKQNNYIEALNSITLCLKEDASDYRYNSLAGNIYLHLKDLDLALEHTLFSLKQKTDNNFYAMNNLALISYRKGEVEKAEKYFKLALKANPNKRMTRNNLVRVQIELGNLEEAFNTSCENKNDQTPVSKTIFEILTAAIETDNMELAKRIVIGINQNQTSDSVFNRLNRIVSGEYSKENSLKHVEKHFWDDDIKSIHGVFSIDPQTLHTLIDNLDQYSFETLPVGIRKYRIPCKNAGYSGGKDGDQKTLNSITILTALNEDYIITAYPSD